MAVTPSGWLDILLGVAIGAVINLAYWASTRVLSQKEQEANKIVIDSPTEGESVRPLHLIAGLRCFQVTGHLAGLPDRHRVCLLIQDPVTRKVWPQSFNRASYSVEDGTWTGYVYAATGTIEIYVVAVVAPPTSISYFGYYQDHGGQTGWDPLPGIPDECTNFASVTVAIS
jgi:hypothetical protein